MKAVGWMTVAAAALGSSRLQAESGRPVQHPGTRRMAERLAQHARAADPEKNTLFFNAQRAELFRKREAQATDFADTVRFRMLTGYELVLAGRPDEGVNELLEVRRVLSQPTVRPSPQTIQALGELLAIGYLRLGEQENCIARHSADSCLMPIRGDGVHTLPRGSRAAIEELTALLQENPNDLKSKWLISLAYMTLGEYPEKVPPAYLIPPRVFESDYPLPRFFDVAPKAGLAKVGLAGGCITEDFDADGDLDLMVSSWGLMDQLRYYRNNSDGTFTDRTEAAGLIGEVGGLNICHADYNNDGRSDVLVLRGAWLREQGKLPNSLLRNNGDGTFEDVTEEAGLLSFHPTQTGTWGDYDNDGWLDLFIGNESTAAEAHPCELFHNNADGTFSEIAAQVRLAHRGFVKAAVWGDYNNDGRLDLYLSCLNEPNALYRNDGPSEKRKEGPPKTNHVPNQEGTPRWSFTNVTAQAGAAEPIRSFPAWFWDYNNDGWQDILVASYAVFMTDSVSTVAADYLGLPNEGEVPRLYRNNHDGTFTDVAKPMRLNKVLLVMGSNFGDLDNDGWLDCYFGTGDPLFTTLIPNRMFRNVEGKVFQDVTTAGGFGHVQKGHAVSFADLDNDGDQDIYEVMGGAYSGDVFQNTLYENPGFGNHWITLRLEGTRSNRSAIGARIKVTVGTESSDRDIHMTVSTGGSFGSDALQQEIGLGQATDIRAIEVHWPTTGQTQVFRNIQMDQFWSIREGDPEPKRLELKKFDLSPGGAEGAQCPHHPG